MTSPDGCMCYGLVPLMLLLRCYACKECDTSCRFDALCLDLLEGVALTSVDDARHLVEHRQVMGGHDDGCP